jgi:predicted Zn finger-like uncharacterized protein
MVVENTLRRREPCVIFAHEHGLKNMILTCPNCETRYRADAAQFPAAGRRVRCAKCGHLWHHHLQDAETGSRAAVEAMAQGPAAADTRANAAVAGPPAAQMGADQSNKSPKRSWAERLGVAAGWAGLFVMILLIGWIAFRFRQEVATLWPQSSSLYATFGIAVNAGGIEIDNVSYRRVNENGQVVLAVTGKLVNITSREVTVPPVRVALTDNDQRELYHWSFQPPQPVLKPGQSLNFLTRLTSPPPPPVHLQLRFASQD